MSRDLVDRRITAGRDPAELFGRNLFEGDTPTYRIPKERVGFRISGFRR